MRPVTVVNAAWLVFLLVWLAFALRAKRTVDRRGRRQGIVMRMFVIVIAFGLFRSGARGPIAEYSKALQGNALVSISGAVLTVVGIACAIWARVHIGRNWGMPMSVKEQPELVTTGPYRLVRHPIYTGMLIAMLGSALAGEIGWLLIFILSGIYFVYSARTEERLMLEQFGEQYAAYVKRTKMLIPFVF